MREDAVDAQDELDEAAEDAATPVDPAAASPGGRRGRAEVQARPSTDKPGFIYVQGSIVAVVERLDEELNKALQQIDAHTTEYMDRLRSEM